MPRLFDRGLALLVALCLLVTSACGHERPGASENESEARDVGGAASSLIEGRTVEVEKWTAGKRAVVRQDVTSAARLEIAGSSMVDAIVRHCAGVAYASSQTLVSSTVPDVTKANACVAETVRWESFPPYVESATAVCAANWALHLAEATSPTYVFQDSTFPIVLQRRDVVVPPWDLANTSASSVDWLQNDANLAYVAKPATASDSATWALVASELFRAGALAATRFFNSANCVQAFANAEYANTLFQTRSNLLDDVAANLADSSLGMMEAAEKAQKYISASAAQKRTTGGDQSQAVVDAWRARQDSRLEVASVYAPIAEERFETVKLIPIWEMTKDDVISATTGNQPNSYYTTSPDEPVETGYKPVKRVGWAYPPNINPVPANTVALRTWRSAVNTSIYLTTTQDATWVRNANNFGSTANGVALRLEGYVASASSRLATTLTTYRSTAEAVGARRYTLSTSTTAPTGYANATAPVHVFSSAEGASTPGARPFAVAAFPAASIGDKRAEQLLRATRVNPCMADSGNWCREAARANRDLATVAGDLLAMAKRDGGNVATIDSYTLFLQQRGITLTELRQAAHRIVRESEVLGRQIMPDPAWPMQTDLPGTTENEAQRPSRVFGTTEDPTPPHPAYLYARTAGHVQFDRKVTGFMGTMVNPVQPTYSLAYPRSSVISAAHYLQDSLASALSVISASGQDAMSHTRIVKEAKAYLSHHIGGAMRIYELRATGTSDPNQLTSVMLEQGGLPYTTAQAFRDSCRTWLGEAGLSCALTGTVGGEPCNADAYRFVLNASSSRITQGGIPFFQTYLNAATDAPLRAGARRLYVGDRVYHVCNLANGPEVVHAAELTAPPTIDEWWWAHLPPMSTSLLDALSTSLAADPFTTSESGVSCAGVPYNVKVALEDEITEAQTGRDDIESSFAHYMDLARRAADQADRLGEDLVEQGIQLDMRAEEAREQLEDLCGGVIDVGKLETAACSAGHCDVVKLLEQASLGASVTGDPIFDSELEGVAHCLGIQSPPVWAAVGDQPLCIWQFYPAVGSPVPPPMVCPGGHAQCKDLPKTPLVLTCPDNMACTCGSMFRQGMQDWAAGTTPAANTVLARRVGEKLNLQVVEHKTEDKPVDQNGFACSYELLLRRLAGTDGLRFNDTEITQLNLKNAAEAIGYEENIQGLPTVTVNGRPWLQFGDASGPLPEEELDFSPCVQHPKVAAGSCTGAAANSMFCASLDCSNMRNVRDRMRAAIFNLKGITGASFDNVVVRKTWLHDAESSEGLTQAGTVPTWFVGAKDNTDYFLSDDMQEAGFYCRDKFCRSKLSRIRPEPEPTRPLYQDWFDAEAGMNTLGDSGWVNPVNLWDRDSRGCRSGDARASYLGCGDVRELLHGKKEPVKAQVRYDSICPPVPNVQLYHRYQCHRTGSSQNEPDPTDTCPQYNGSITDSKSRSFVVPGAGGCTCKPMATTTTLKEIRDLFDTRSDAASDSRYQFIRGEVRRYACGTHTAGTEIPWSVVMDGLELACAARERGALGCSAPDEDFEIRSVEDLPAVRGRVMCAANTVQDTIDRMYLPDVPSDVVRALQASGLVQTYPQFRGEYGTLVAKLGAQLIALTTQGKSIVQHMRDVGFLLDTAVADSQVLDLNIAISNVDSQINSGQEVISELEAAKAKVRTRQAIFNATTSCVTAMAKATSDFSAWVTGAAAGDTTAAVATCVNSGLQIQGEMEIAGYDEQIGDVQADIFAAIDRKLQLGEKVLEVEKTALMYRLSMDIGAKITMMYESLSALQTAQAEIHATLASLDVTRNKARRNAAKLLMLDNDDVGRQYAVNSAMRARMNTRRVRYERARDNAVRLAYIARRAVEQRLGVEMSLMGDDMTLVEAPNKWVDKLCSLSAIDYDAIREGKPASEDEEDDVAPESYDYAEGYIGDWLTQLENFVQSYRLDHHFDDGEDFAVVSLRDEIVRAKKDVRTDGWNHLFYTDGALMPATDDAQLGWDFTCNGTQKASLDQLGLPGPYLCSGESELSCRSLGDARAVMLSRTPSDCLVSSDDDEAPVARVTSGPARVRQTVEVGPGRYWLSWHQRRADPALTAFVELPDGSTQQFTPTKTKVDTIFPAQATDVPADSFKDVWLIQGNDGWVRYYKEVVVSDVGDLTFGLAAPATPVMLAAPQLEMQSGDVSTEPKSFFPTSDVLDRVTGKTEDRFGEVFRTMWDEGEEYYCPGSGPCATDGDASNLPRRHYRELKFSLDLNEIEKGETIHSSGFARGNFNYRFDQLALNIVGTALKDCENSQAPSTCYASNFVQFSLRHGAPFRVRNHAGDTVEAPLFVGRIQQAKALLAERYLSNPPSGSDEQLLSRYWRDEFRGRPLDGNFVLRIYDDEADGFDFDAVEDIQIALKYRYWTPGE